MSPMSADRSPGARLGLAILVAMLLSIPLFSVWLLVYDRKEESRTAQASIAEGWGGPQTVAGPLLVIPYRSTASETVSEGGRPVVRSREVWRELTLSPETVRVTSDIRPERRRRSIYEVVVYEAAMRGNARFALPADLSRFGLSVADMALERAEIRFGISDPRGLGPSPRVAVAGQPLRLQPGGGAGPTGGAGFFAWFDAASLARGAVGVDFAFGFRGNGRVSFAPQAGETVWQVRSAWPHPSFQGGFLPAERQVTSEGFNATYRIGNLALGQSLIATGPAAERAQAAEPARPAVYDAELDAATAGGREARVSLVQPVDLYSRVDRAAKYGFLFIGFTFLAFLLFDIVGGVRVSGVEYLLVGAALVLFFVLLLAFAEVVGFTPAYVIASAAIVGLNSLYSAAVLGSWRRAAFILGLLGSLYTVLYILLSLKAFSLLIGSLMLFLALAALMYLTRNVRWGGVAAETEEAEAAAV